MNNMDFLCLLPFPHVCKKIKSNYEKHAHEFLVIAASTLRFVVGQQAPLALSNTQGPCKHDFGSLLA